MSLITINKVNCKDCYKCVRYCPVKAIRVVDGHAEVVEERCLGDGSCLQVCPQRAKQVRSDVDIVRTLLASGRPVIASIAPSAAGIFGDELPHLLGALKLLGFARVEDTSRTAEAVAKACAAYAAGSEQPVITTACPAVVALVCKYYPQYESLLAPVPSPMVAHARLLREEYGKDAAVVFIGPCVGKKSEADTGTIDAALTFDELRQWLAQENIDLHAQPVAEYDHPPVGIAQAFPLPNGLLRSAGQSTDLLASEVLTVTGIDDVMSLLEHLPTLEGVRLVETLACADGCLQGPGASQGAPHWARRGHLLRVVREGQGAAPVDMRAEYPATPLNLPQPTDEEIVAILHRTGKQRPEDEHNCGACGYDTCREKAVAVFQGMAEAEMCIPYMRSRAESFSNVVLRATPNGIVLVDEALRILDANPALATIFHREQNDLIGRHISTVAESSGYDRVRRTEERFVRQEVTYGDRIVREMIFPLKDEGMILGLYIDVTDEVARRQQLQRTKQETLGKAGQVIQNQMRVAQEIAGLLGETTAETKVLLTKLIQLYDEE